MLSQYLFLGLPNGLLTGKSKAKSVSFVKHHTTKTLVECKAPTILNPLTPNNEYSGHTAPLNSKCCILYIYSTNTGTEYLKK